MSTDSRVLVVARLERVRAIERFLISGPRKFDVAAASSDDELREKLLELPPETVVFDQLSDIGDRRSCLALVAKTGAGIPVVVVGPELDYDDAVKAFEEGAADYVATDNLERLAWTLERALRSNRDRLAREEGLERQLTASIRRFQVYADASGERLRYLALHHPVSGLPNRHALACYLSGLAPDQPIAIAAVEINKTAHIASARGHAFAERIFSQMGSQLRREGVFVSHVEGPLFLTAWNPAGTLEQEAAQLEAQLVCLEEQGTELDGQEVHVTFRAGIAVGLAHERESVEKDAHAALSKAFKHGQRLVPFNEEVRRRVARTIDLERELRHALDREEFELHYQPKVSASTGRLTGAEALLRWRRQDDRLVSPADFIPLLEDTGLIVPVGRWVMAQALATTLHWRRTLWPGLRVAVNVSAQEFRHRDFLTRATDLLEPFAACQPIDIELTESVLVEDVEQSADVLQQVRNLGCKIDIDDFGTGYSSLNYLIKLPIDGIKIDRSFIAVLTESPEKMAISSTIISLAHSLGLSVVAEGVEREDQARLLHLLRCDFLQGFLFGRSMDAQAFAETFLVGDRIENPADGMLNALPAHLEQPKCKGEGR